MKKIFSILIKIVLLFFALVGLYQGCLFLQESSTQRRSERIEAEERHYDSHLLYNTHGGEPLFLIDPAYEKTLFFMEGFRAQAPAGMYRRQLRDFHREEEVNIIVPVYGLQSWPFEQRNREWYFQEDMRQVLQIWEAYTRRLPENHRLVTASMSFGTLPHAAIAAFAQRPPDEMIFFSPLNQGMDYKAAGPVIRWFSRQTVWLRHILPYAQPGKAPTRASVWDIVNDEINKEYAATGMVNPEDNAHQAYLSERAAAYLEAELLPLIQGRDISVIWGQEDLFFSQEGFRHFSDILEKGENRVTARGLPRTGHMVLLDNGRATAWEALKEAVNP